MKKLSAYFLIIIALISCNNEKTGKKTDKLTETDTLAYTYKTISVYHQPIKKADTTSAVINFPVFDNDNLNNYIKRQVFDFFDPKEQVTSYQDIANSFINGYNEFSKENPDAEQTWYLQIDIRVLRQFKNYIALAYTHQDFAGGAHGNTSIAYLNYNTETQSPITLNSLFDDHNKKKLTQIAEKIFRKNEGLTTTESLSENYFFENGEFDLAKNFYIGKKGLVFLYNPYEIKAYVNGTTELIVPFTAIKGLSNPNSILSKLL
jgi:hypothetical protein